MTVQKAVDAYWQAVDAFQGLLDEFRRLSDVYATHGPGPFRAGCFTYVLIEDPLAPGGGGINLTMSTLDDPSLDESEVGAALADLWSRWSSGRQDRALHDCKELPDRCVILTERAALLFDRRGLTLPIPVVQA